MSAKAVGWAREVRGLTVTEKLVLILLADHANVHPERYGSRQVAWPKQQMIADEMEVSSRTVLRAMAALEEKGLVSRERQHRDDGSRRADLYTLNLLGDNLAQRGPMGNPKVTPMTPTNLTPMTTQGDTGVQSKVTLVSQQELEEEPKEEQERAGAPFTADPSSFSRQSPALLVEAVNNNPKARRGREVPIPAAWLTADMPPTDLIAMAKEKGLRPNEIGPTWRAFTTWHASKDTRYVRWEWTWRNWVEKEVARNRTKTRTTTDPKSGISYGPPGRPADAWMFGKDFGNPLEGLT
jgi:DNA-binding MarR family transcriptional regulator